MSKLELQRNEQRYYHGMVENMLEAAENYASILDSEEQEIDDEKLSDIAHGIADSLIVLMLRKPAELRYKLLELFNAPRCSSK